MAKAIEFTVEPALLKTIGAWRTWLSVERNCSDHTLDGYGRDLSTFLNFLLDHLGYRPGLRDLEQLKSGDFRSFLAKGGSRRLLYAQTCTVVRQTITKADRGAWRRLCGARRRFGDARRRPRDAFLNPRQSAAPPAAGRRASPAGAALKRRRARSKILKSVAVAGRSDVI